MKLLGIDIGGTFTDLVLADLHTGVVLTHKVPTWPADPSAGALEGIRTLCDRHGVVPGEINHVFHGTTIATNAVLEHDGAVTGMITTQGFRDIVHIGRHQRPQNYSIIQDIPWQARPFVPRRNRKVVRERLVPPHGDVLIPLDEEGVRRAAGELRDEGVEAIAICFLFSYLDPRHELLAESIVREEHPDAFVTVSSRVSPQFREFERFTTTTMNAFVGPKLSRYVRGFTAGLKTMGIEAELHVMGSHGGVATAAMVCETPLLTLLSGPAAGVLGGAWSAALSDRGRIITFDVGGTSADIGIAVDGSFSEAAARDSWIGGYPVLVPMIDITTIGAGGGSIAHVESGGAFRVGPQSAGSYPGPAAYGRGGEQPTVTDANVVLGRLDPDALLGGEMRLDATAARRVVKNLADRLKLDTLEAAEGMVTVINSSMANAIRARTVQKGLDPRGFSLVAFGGAGPLHGAEVAAMLEIPEVIVPPHPGLTSATGLLTTDLKFDRVKTQFQVQDALDLDRLNRDFAGLEADLLSLYEDNGVPSEEVELLRSGDLRYVGQGYELRIELASGAFDGAALDAAWDSFHRRHQADYGHVFRGKPVEIVNIRVTGLARMPKIGRPAAAAGDSLAEAVVRTRPCVFRVGGTLEQLDTSFYHRERLPLDELLRGPAVILQRDSTTLVPPGWQAVAQGGGNLVLRRGS